MNTETASGAIALDDEQRAFTYDGKQATLTDTEFRVLKALATKAGTVVSRSELTYALYVGKPEPAKSNVLEVLVMRLRKKFAELGAPALIQTQRGHGYTYVGAVTPIPSTTT